MREVQRMYKQPFLTIGIANYNYSQHLIKAFKQIKAQKFIDYELLYCDDGSTDESLKIINTIIHENPQMNIRIYAGKHEGILENRNRIIDNARGKYLLICDADDYMESDCLKKLCDLAEKEDADCIIGGFDEVDEKGRILKQHIPKLDANKWLYTWHHAQIYKMDLVRDNQIRFIDLPDDVCFLQQIHLHSKKVFFVSDVLYKWIRHSDSTSVNIEKNYAWHPQNIWKSLAEFISGIRDNVKDEGDILSLNYYLYKWYYFNIADVPENYNETFKEMQFYMKKSCPNYRNLSFFCKILKVKDTYFARCALIFCWMLEGMGGLFFIPRLRRMQHKIRGI